VNSRKMSLSQIKMFILFLVNSFILTSAHELAASIPSNPDEPINRAAILDVLSEAFLDSNNDFIMPMLRSHLFPLREKSEAINKEIDRYNFENINDEEKAANLTEDLKMWRGFQSITLEDVSDVIPFLALTSSLETSTLEDILGDDKLDGSVLEELPLSWFNLFEKSRMSVDKSVQNLINIVKKSPLNTAALYKSLNLLRDVDEDKRKIFLETDFSEYFVESVAYMIGYRWILDNGADIPVKILMNFPSDTIFDIDTELYGELNLDEKLSDKDSFHEAEQWKKNAWFRKFVDVKGWEKVVGTSQDLKKFGHLLSGASMEDLQLLSRDDLDQDTLESVFKGNKFNPSSTRVIWEIVKEERRGDLFAEKVEDLDISQLVAFATNGPSSIKEHKENLDSSWFNKPKLPGSWVNTMLVAQTLMPNEMLSSWTKDDITTFGKFIKIFSPSEILKLGDEGEEFSQDVVSAVVSPSLGLAQLTAIYNKYKKQMTTETQVSEPIHPILFSALSTADILASPPRFIWTEDKDKLLDRSSLFTPGQMNALHEIMYPYHWNSYNMSSILITHPMCLADVRPKEIKSNLASVLDGIEAAGPHKFYVIAEKIQHIPRYLKMAWLEEALEKYEMTKEIETDVILDKVTEDAVPDSTINNPDDSHPLSMVFDRWTSDKKSYLTSLAISGISCKQIKLIKVHDMMEVYAMYRYQLTLSGGSMPSSSRKCWAKKLRDYLMFKAKILNIDVDTETELLSMLTTSDIKTIGGELLLTWGGTVLSSIINPEVTHEVLMEVALTDPSTFLSNGVKYSCMKEMAKSLLTFMQHHENGKMNFMVLTHVHNLVPFADSSLLEAEAEHLKHWVRTVLDDSDKTICLKRDERQNMRDLLLKAYGNPSGWNSLDLIEMGDLLLVMRESDLDSVDPTSLRMAAAQLATNTRYSVLVDEVRGSVGSVMFHEACQHWLGHDEARGFHIQWKHFNQFIVVGNFLQFEVLHSNWDNVPSPRENVRRKRQADAGVGTASAAYYKQIYDEMMRLLGEMFRSGQLSNQQVATATNIINLTQDLLADSSFAVLGLERGDMTAQQILAVLQQYRDSNRLTPDQSTKINQLAIDTQIRMIQQISPVIGINHLSLGLSEQEYNDLLSVPTFVVDDSTPTTLAPFNTEELLPIDPPSSETDITPTNTETDVQNTGETAKTSDEVTENTNTGTENANEPSDDISNTKTVETVDNPDNEAPSSDNTNAVDDTAANPDTIVESSTQKVAAEADVDSSNVSLGENTTVLPDNTREGKIVDETQSTNEEDQSEDSTDEQDDETVPSTDTGDSTPTDEESSDDQDTVTQPPRDDNDDNAADKTNEKNEETKDDKEPTYSNDNTEDDKDSSDEPTADAPEDTKYPTEDFNNVIAQANELSKWATFNDFEPDTESFNRIPSIDNIILTCDVLIASGDAASILTDSHISIMSKSDLVNCLDTLGHVPYPHESIKSIWKSLRDRVDIFKNDNSIDRDMMIQLNNLLPAVVKEDLDLLDVSEKNIDGLSIIGKLLEDDCPVDELMQKYISVNDISPEAPLTRTEAGSLRQILCGLTDEQWISQISKDNFPALITEYFSKIQCSVSNTTANHLVSLLISDDLYGAPSTWTASDVLSLGWLASTLSVDQLSSIPSHAIEGLTGEATKFFTGSQWIALTGEQLAYLSPHAASFLSTDKIAQLTKSLAKIREIRAAVGEDEEVVEDMVKMMSEMTGGGGFTKPSFMLMVVLLVIYLF